jgi:hypothetical protein
MTTVFDQILARTRRQTKTLRNLKIDEVSSVSAGAGRGVRVVMLKRDNIGVEPMSEFSTSMSVIEKSNHILENVDNPNALALAIKRLADESGMTLAQFHATPHGQELLQKSVTMHRVRVTLSTANGDGYEYAKSMSGEEGTAPGARQHNRDNRARHAQGQDHNPDPEEPSEESANKKASERFKELAEAYSKVHSVSLDRAYQAVSATELGKMLLKQDARNHGIYR